MLQSNGIFLKYEYKMMKLRFNACGSKTFIAAIQSTLPVNNID
jgi:hypothetical protein